jgi:hypothetical protein
MPKEYHRKSRRHFRNHQAWMTFVGKSDSFDCRVLEVSQDGAKLLADIVAPVGTRLHLSPTPNVANGKKCEVVWKKGRTLGVKFV